MRQPTEFEIGIIQKILETYHSTGTFSGQVDGIQVEPLPHSDNYGSIELIPKNVHKLKTFSKLEGDLDTVDSDGVKISALLYSKSQVLDELEFIRVDGNPIIHMPAADSFNLPGISN